MKKKLIIGLIITVAIAGFVILAILKSTGASSGFGGNAYSVEVETVVKGEISSYVSANGIIEDKEKAEIYFDSTLKVREILTVEGQKVTRGQKVLDLDTDSLKAELKKLMVNKSIQEISLDSSASDVSVKSAESAVDSAKRAYEDSFETYEENKDKYLAGAITKEQIEMSEDSMKTAEAAYNNARNSYEAAMDSRRITRLTAEENLRIIEISINELEKQINSIEESMMSPMDGIVAAINVEKGAFTSAMQPAYKVIDPDRLQVKAYVKEYDSKSVMAGQNVRITGDAIDDSEEVTGRIMSVSPSAFTNATTSGNETVVEIIVSIDNVVGNLKPGLNVTCDIYTVDKKDVIIIPMEAITYDKDGNKKVFIVNTETNTMVEKQIETGINSDMSVEVLEGLSEGDVLILEHQPSFKDGVKVKISEEGTK